MRGTVVRNKQEEKCPICSNTGVYIDHKYYSEFGLTVINKADGTPGNTLGRRCPNLCKPVEIHSTIKGVVIGWFKPWDDVPYLPDAWPYDGWRIHKLKEMEEEEKKNAKVAWAKLKKLFRR